MLFLCYTTHQLDYNVFQNIILNGENKMLEVYVRELLELIKQIENNKTNIR